MKYLVVLALGFFVFASQSCYYDNEEDLFQTITVDCDMFDVKYTTHVAEIMTTHCAVTGCHTAQAMSGGIDLSTYATVSSSDRIYGTITHQTGFSAMPPGGQQIPQCEQDIIKSWIDNGKPE